MIISELARYQRYYSEISEILPSHTLWKSLCILTKTNRYPAQSDEVHPKEYSKKCESSITRDLLYDKATFHVPAKAN